MPIGTINDEVQYARRVITLSGSFRISGTSNPDNLWDGKSEIISSVVRGVAGAFTVNLAPGFPIPRQITMALVDIASAAAPTKFTKAFYVRDSYNPDTRLFIIRVVNHDGTAAIEDPDDNDVISFHLRGPAVDTFKDAVQ